MDSSCRRRPPKAPFSQISPHTRKQTQKPLSDGVSTNTLQGLGTRGECQSARSTLPVSILQPGNVSHVPMWLLWKQQNHQDHLGYKDPRAAGEDATSVGLKDADHQDPAPSQRERRPSPQAVTSCRWPRGGWGRGLTHDRGCSWKPRGMRSHLWMR